MKKDEGINIKVNTKCLNCGINIFSEAQVYCTNCQWDSAEQEWESAQQKILKAYEKITGYNSQDGCTYCGIYQNAPLWKHGIDCYYYRPRPKNKESISCICGGQSFLNKPELHDKNCPIYIYYYKTDPKSINYYPQSVAPDSHYEPDYYKEKANKELQDINRAKQLALEKFLAQQIVSSDMKTNWITGTISKSEPEPKKEEEIEIEKPKKRVIDFD